jgi:hypothetical protein
MSAFERLLVPGFTELPCVGAGKICTPQASTHYWKEPTHISASTIVLRATMRCGLLFGVPTQ